MNKIKLLAFLLVLIGFCTGCNLIKPVELQAVENISINTGSKVKVTADITLYNPNFVGMSLAKHDLAIYIEDSYIGLVQVPEGLVLAKKGSTKTRLSVETSLTSLMVSAPQLLPIIRKGSFKLKIKGSIYPEGFLMPNKVKINHSVKVDL